MRLWRNRQTRTFAGRLGTHPGSSPGNRPTVDNGIPAWSSVFFISVGAVTGTWQRILGEFSKILYINIDIFC